MDGVNVCVKVVDEMGFGCVRQVQYLKDKVGEINPAGKRGRRSTV